MYIGITWIGFIWLRIGTDEKLLEMRRLRLGSINRGGILNPLRK